jgi:hypothetical protein
LIAADLSVFRNFIERNLRLIERERSIEINLPYADGAKRGIEDEMIIRCILDAENKRLWLPIWEDVRPKLWVLGDDAQEGLQRRSGRTAARRSQKGGIKRLVACPGENCLRGLDGF